MSSRCINCGSTAHVRCMMPVAVPFLEPPTSTRSAVSVALPPMPTERNRLIKSYQPPGTSPLSVTVRFCRTFFDWAVPDGNIDFPSNPNRYFGLEIVKDEVTIGRSDVVRSIYPDVDINSFTGDLAVSVNHALLRVSANGDLLITDLGSKNGTFVGSYTSGPLRPGLSVPVAWGQSVYMGAWTELIFGNKP